MSGHVAENLRPLAPGVAVAESSLRMSGGLELPVRMATVRLPDGTQWVWSPLAMTDDVARRIEEAGPVRHLVAPNLFHHLGLEAAKSRYPDAKLWAPKGLEKKQPRLSIDEHLSQQSTWEGAFTTIPVQGATLMSEWSFFHAESRTLFLTDLIFNLDGRARGLGKLILQLMGTHDRLAFSRLWKLATRDKSAFQASLRRILDLPVEQVVMAHGEILREDARAALTEVLSPHC